MFKRGLIEGINKHIPQKTSRSKDSCSWINSDLRRKISRRDKAYSASKKTGTIRDENKFCKLKREVQRDLRQAYWSHVEDIVTPQDSDQGPHTCMKRFWSFIKQKKTDHNGVAPLKSDGKLVSEPRQKAEILNKQFQSVFTHETDFSIAPPEDKPPIMPPINIRGGEVTEKPEPTQSGWA